MIYFNDKTKTFYLETEKTSYIFRIIDGCFLSTVYYGAKIDRDDMRDYNFFSGREFCPEIITDGKVTFPTCLLQEYSTFGRGDFRTPAIMVKTNDGRTINQLTFSTYKIHKTKPELENLPSLKNDNKNSTLEVVLEDAISGFSVSLFYSVFDREDAITRWAVIKNISDKKLDILSAASLNLDLSDMQDYDIITLDGAWARERHINRRPLSFGTTSVQSRRGATGHEHNPFIALVNHNTSEDCGQVYATALIYSANFKASVEKDSFNSARCQIGISPDGFSWELLPDATFTTPEAILVYSNNGLNGMSKSFHSLCLNHLGASADKTIRHPIVINNWESMYFEVDGAKMEKFIHNCVGLGIDTVVLDDGWFGTRNSDNGSLGDWFINEAKFPNGLEDIIDLCHENYMNFGIWIEPEMISVKSKLYESHPDWCIHTQNRVPVESRNQLILDFTRKEVVDYVYNTISTLLKKYKISYVKWDMNRNITDNGSDWLWGDRQGEFNHRYILGVYDLARRLTTEFKDVVFEGCSGGGGRFDFGMLYFMPQIWTSDDTDALERMKIQYGTSLVYPPAVMSAHISAVPNHQTGRTVSFETRANVAQFFSFGYELDVGQLTDEEKRAIISQTDYHRSIEALINNGDFYRLCSPFEENYCAWQLVSQDKKKSAVMISQLNAEPASAGRIIRLKGLSPDKKYKVEPLEKIFSGNTLMNAGLPILILQKDRKSFIFNLQQV